MVVLKEFYIKTEKKLVMENNKIAIKDIPLEENYEGYLWLSNETKPHVYQNEPLEKVMLESVNPFIIEGNLLDKNNRKSYSIRFIDGNYIVNEFDLKELNEKYSEDSISKEYIPNRFPEKINKLYFREYWIPKKDEQCKGMEVLKPAMEVFTGFNKEDKL